MLVSNVGRCKIQIFDGSNVGIACVMVFNCRVRIWQLKNNSTKHFYQFLD